MNQPWTLSWESDPYVARIADRHYSRRASSIGSNRFSPPGQKLVLKAVGPAAWVSLWPDEQYVDHNYPDAWLCTLFRREGGDVLASDLIRAAAAATRWKWPTVPAGGMVTFVNARKVRAKRDPGYCFLRAGFRRIGVTGGGVDRSRPLPIRHARRGRSTRCAAGARPMTRPVQLGLLEGADKAVGPLLSSVVHGSNADLIAAIAPLYLTGSVLDVTYGRGMWWRRHRPEHLVAHDLDLDGVDFRDLPHQASSFDTVCFDPPYVPRHGSDHVVAPRDHDFRQRFGLVEPRTELQMRQLINDGLTECARVARRWVLVKCNDYCNGRQFHLGHVRVLEHAATLGLRCHDLLIHASGTGPGGGQILTPKRARRAHSYLLVFAKPTAVSPQRDPLKLSATATHMGPDSTPTIAEEATT